jgi:diguanylate cyclase (GGDEF)-like protein
VDSWLASLRLHGQADGSFELSDGHLLRMSACTLPSSAIAVMVVCSVSEGESANLAMAERDRLGATLDALRDRAMALDGARKATEARLQEAVRRAELAEARATELEAMAHTDPLTGLLNRRRLLDLARIEIARARRHGRRLAILLVDVDRFKQVNDALGHRAGDAVLQDISRVCAARLRACDLLARWGGEEFLVVLPDTDPAGARRAAERLRIAVDGAPRGQGERSLRLTVSIGYAELLQGENCIGPAVDRADAALYAAKTSGRNRIVGI